MFKIDSAAQLLECFRPLDRDEVIVPEELKFPLFVRDYLAWLEPSGNRVYLVFSEGLRRQPLGISFRRDGGNSSVTTAAMCDWCHSVRAGDSVGLLSAAASDRRRVGLPLCRDLSCKDKMAASLGDEREKIKRVIARMSAFARRELF